MTVVETKVDSEGNLTTQDHLVHVTHGDVYTLQRWDINGNVATLYFPDDSSSKVHGVAPMVEASFCDFQDSQIVEAQAAQAAAPKGCGCGH